MLVGGREKGGAYVRGGLRGGGEPGGDEQMTACGLLAREVLRRNFLSAARVSGVNV